jgi:arylsulfatase A-like enzyme
MRATLANPWRSTVEPGEFQGVRGRFHQESTPWWPPPTSAPAGAPNIVLVVLDDVGFAQLGCYGSDIRTPTIDGLAAAGLRYTNFHTTALCSPTRAALLTGRNHHANGMGRVAELATGFPGYDARIPRANGLLPEILVPAGYAAWAVGKWHLTPDDETHLGASRSRWPLGRGFERFYGFFEGETHQLAPSLAHDNHRINPPGAYDSGYHLTEDLTDRAIGFVRDLRMVDDAKPFFLYFATGACHSPHQPPAHHLEAYRGQFDDGWDVWRTRTFDRQLAAGLLPATTELSPRPDWVPAWADLDADDRRLSSRYMEAFAGFLTHTDEQLGRLVDALRETGDLDNTLLLALSDNGASSEGGPTGSLNDVRIWNGAHTSREEALRRIDEIGGPWCHNNYPWGWTVAGNTPFRRWKREVHEGGVADPLVVHWPAVIRRGGELRDHYVHAVDVAPTLLDAADIEPPDTIGGVAQRGLDGASFAPTFTDVAAPTRTTQYYEMFGCRALYDDGWKAVTYHPIQADAPGLDNVAWELYDVRVDRSECHDLAVEQPERLARMVERWWQEAERNEVLPLDNRPFSAFVFERPTTLPARNRYVYYPGPLAVPEPAAVNVRNRSHRITAHVQVGATQPSGVMLAQGSRLGGWTFYLQDGQLHYLHNFVGLSESHIVADAALEEGDHRLGFAFTKTGEHRGVGALFVDGQEVGRGEVTAFTPVRFSLMGAGLSCGRDVGLPVTTAYDGEHPFDGPLLRVVVEVDGAMWVDPDEEATAAIAQQ